MSDIGTNGLLCQTKQIRFYEQFAKNSSGISEEMLMRRAGKAAFDAFLTFYSHLHSLAVYCGGGNNAGDGYVFAQIAKEAGYKVTLYTQKSPQDLPPVACKAALDARSAGIPFCHLQEKRSKTDLIVDALLGIGLHDNVKGELKSVIHEMNQSHLPILALDVPSGLNADTGLVHGIAVKAALTVTFITSKVGLMTGDGPDYSGHIICNDLGLRNILKKTLPAAYCLNDRNALPIFPATRSKNSHKGDFGCVLVIGGEEGMPGAVLMAAQAAARVGAGLVMIATKPAHRSAMVTALPEALIYGVESVQDIEPLIRKATVCVFGPGLGEDVWAKTLWEAVVTSSLPLVMDASALRILANMNAEKMQKFSSDSSINMKRSNWILTPHPGEAAALLQCSTAEIQSDRCHALRALQKLYGGYPILKGLGSLISQEEGTPPYLCASGNPGMASAGMGDVLSGILGGLVAQGLPLIDAAKVGVWLHAAAADAAASVRGERGLLATDLMPYLSTLINQCNASLPPTHS